MSLMAFRVHVHVYTSVLWSLLFHFQAEFKSSSIEKLLLLQSNEILNIFRIKIKRLSLLTLIQLHRKAR